MKRRFFLVYPYIAENDVSYISKYNPNFSPPPPKNDN